MSLSVSISGLGSASSSAGGGGYVGDSYHEPIQKPLSASEAIKKRAQDASKLRDRARKYLETIPWISSLMHNETLLELAQKHGISNTTVESDVSFLEERLDAQVFEAPIADRVRRIESLRELDKYVHEPPTPWSSLAGKPRVYLVCLEGLSTDAIGLVCSLLDVHADALALHLVSTAPLHYSLPSSLNNRPSMQFEYMSLVESSILTKNMSFSMPSYGSANNFTAVFLLKNNQTLDYRAERSFEFYLRQPRFSTSMDTGLSFPAAFKASLQETIRLAGEDPQNRQSISSQFLHGIVEAVYPVIISECTAVLDYLNKELKHNRSVLEECGDGSFLKRKVREQKLKDALPRMSSFYNVQHDILNGLLRNLDETILLFRSIDEENVGPGTQRQAQEQQHPRIQQYRADINTLISHTDHFRKDNDLFTQQRQAILDAILPPEPPSSPAARYMQNRLDQIVFSTNPLLSLTFIATVFGMNLDVIVDGGLVSLATYLITAFVFAFVVFCATFFYKPVVFWIEHFARGRGAIVPRIDLKAGRREEGNEKWSKKAREIV